MLSSMLSNVRATKPLIQNITNSVTINDCANITLAIGASPIMADAKEEAADIAAISKGLNINIGTLRPQTIEAMVIAGKKANEVGIPVVLDPVGAGASKLRDDTMKLLFENVKFSVIRGNISEIKTLAGINALSHGVDAGADDAIQKDSIQDAIAFAQDFSAKTGAVIAISGAIDIVCDKDKAFAIYNGHPMMADVTGTGCMLSSLTAAYVAANPDNILYATLASVCSMGLCGEIAHKRLSPLDGNSSYRNYIIDAIYNLSPEALVEGAKFDEY